MYFGSDKVGPGDATWGLGKGRGRGRTKGGSGLEGQSPPGGGDRYRMTGVSI